MLGLPPRTDFLMHSDLVSSASAGIGCCHDERSTLQNWAPNYYKATGENGVYSFPFFLKSILKSKRSVRLR
jgi:hypothetical protein